jgi:hypothetical protein
MKPAMIDPIRTLAPMFLVVALLATESSAQFSQGVPTSPQLPGAQQAGGQMTPEQIRDVYRLRALQSRGNRGVRTGYPQFVPYGPAGMMGFPAFGTQNVQPQPAGKSSAQKRAAREEKKRAAREKAEAKKAAAEKAKAEARAKAKNKQKDPA